MWYLALQPWQKKTKTILTISKPILGWVRVTMPGGTWDLLLALHSEITLGGPVSHWLLWKWVTLPQWITSANAIRKQDSEEENRDPGGGVKSEVSGVGNALCIHIPYMCGGGSLNSPLLNIYNYESEKRHMDISWPEKTNSADSRCHKPSLGLSLVTMPRCNVQWPGRTGGALNKMHWDLLEKLSVCIG